MNNNLLPTTPILNDKNIEECIYCFRGQQVMLDSDIAELFNVETKRLNEQMKRNVERFPSDFCFQLNSLEFKSLKSQNATSNKGRGGKQKLPFVYTEHGIITLAGVLKSDVSAKMSVEIARQFIRMRKFILENGDVLLTLAKLQNRQLEFENETNRKFEQVFKLIERLDLPKTALFYAGEWYDAFEYISSMIASANNSIILIDPYCDGKALSFLSHRKDGVKIIIIKGDHSKLKDEEVELFETQYGLINIKMVNDIHDRYLIIDNDVCYSLGTSLNYAGKKLFTINKIEDKDTIEFIINKVNS
ncbi:MAG: ORF6N domain-containing protein [Clostridia bacterium]|nr:ORF6N domain-containing protein [Clostridia bacterium]